MSILVKNTKTLGLLSLPSRPRFSWDVKIVRCTDGHGTQDSYADVSSDWAFSTIFYYNPTRATVQNVGMELFQILNNSDLWTVLMVESTAGKSIQPARSLTLSAMFKIVIWWQLHLIYKMFSATYSIFNVLQLNFPKSTSPAFRIAAQSQLRNKFSWVVWGCHGVRVGIFSEDISSIVYWFQRQP